MRQTVINQVIKSLDMKDRCPNSVGDAKQTLEIRVEPLYQQWKRNLKPPFFLP